MEAGWIEAGWMVRWADLPGGVTFWEGFGAGTLKRVQGI